MIEALYIGIYFEILFLTFDIVYLIQALLLICWGLYWYEKEGNTFGQCRYGE